MLFDRIKNIIKATVNDQLENNVTLRKIISKEENDFDAEVTRLLREQENKRRQEELEAQRMAENYRRQEELNRQQSQRQQQRQTHQKQTPPSSPSQEDKERQYYKDLEVPFGTPFPEIKKAYRKLIKKYHPDLYQGDKKKLDIAQEITRKINEAYTYFENKSKN